MKPVLCIPSYSRPDGVAISRCKDLPLKKLLFIRREQEAMYENGDPGTNLFFRITALI